MNRDERSALGPAVALSALAGYVDSLGFILLGGYFVSFMSGNSTQLGVDLVMHRRPILPALLLALFVLGVALGSLLGHFAARRRPPVILGGVSLLLAAAAGCHGAGWPRCCVAAMVLAMGMENTVIEETAGVRFGLTYVTGSLVKVGQRLAGVLTGTNGPLAWIPFFLLWAGLAMGAVAGTFSYLRWGLNSLWIAAAAAGLLTLSALARRAD
jgi:uncharacterized membrane protein YoaK (UPF0700 family)